MAAGRGCLFKKKFESSAPGGAGAGGCQFMLIVWTFGSRKDMPMRMIERRIKHREMLQSFNKPSEHQLQQNRVKWGLAKAKLP